MKIANDFKNPEIGQTKFTRHTTPARLTNHAGQTSARGLPNTPNFQLNNFNIYYRIIINDGNYV